MKKLILLIASLFSSAAFADGITAGGNDTDAIITLANTHAVSNKVRANGDRIELDVADESAAQIAVLSDATVRKVEVTGGAHAKASLQIKHSAKTTEMMARATRVTQQGDDVVLNIPREGKFAMARLQEPAAPEAPTAAPAPPAPVAATVAVAPPAPAPVPAPAPAPAPAPVAPVALAPTPAPAPAPAPALELADSSPKFPTSSLAVILLVSAAGLGFLYLKKKRAGAAPDAPKHSIEILANRDLGGKTRIVLVAVDDNELLLSVSDGGGARLLGSWPANEEKPEDDWRSATATPALAAVAPRDDWRNATATPRLADPMPAPAGIAPPRHVPSAPAHAARGTTDFGSARAQSPSVSGILRLKLNAAAGSGPHHAADEHDDDGDTGRDAAWVRELVNAARKGSRA